MWRSKTILSDDQINALEAQLAGTLRPVTPPVDVVQRLRERIRFPQSEEIVSRLRDWQRMFFVLGGVMSGMMVLITEGQKSTMIETLYGTFAPSHDGPNLRIRQILDELQNEKILSFGGQTPDKPEQRILFL